MPKKIEMQTELPENSVTIPTPKPKREISEAQREHLNKIRTLALEKKRQMKEVTLKSKLIKTVEKEDLAKKYDDYVAKKVIEEDIAIIKKEAVQQPPKKTKKKVKRYISESETDESESEEEEIIVKKKSTHKPKPEKLEKLVYKNTQEQLYNRMIEERVKNSLMGYSQSLGV